MGISGLLPLLKDAQEEIHISKYKGKVLGVDAYVWLHRGAYGCAQQLALGQNTNGWVALWRGWARQAHDDWLRCWLHFKIVVTLNLRWIRSTCSSIMASPRTLCLMEDIYLQKQRPRKREQSERQRETQSEGGSPLTWDWQRNLLLSFYSGEEVIISNKHSCICLKAELNKQESTLSSV